MLELKVCTACTVWHVENCSTCFGFGLKGEGIPIAAAEAEVYRENNLPFIPCPVCAGTPSNKQLMRQYD